MTYWYLDWEFKQGTLAIFSPCAVFCTKGEAKGEAETILDKILMTMMVEKCFPVFVFFLELLPNSQPFPCLLVLIFNSKSTGLGSGFFACQPHTSTVERTWSSRSKDHTKLCLICNCAQTSFADHFRDHPGSRPRIRFLSDMKRPGNAGVRRWVKDGKHCYFILVFVGVGFWPPALSKTKRPPRGTSPLPRLHQYDIGCCRWVLSVEHR